MTPLVRREFRRADAELNVAGISGYPQIISGYVHVCGCLLLSFSDGLAEGFFDGWLPCAAASDLVFRLLFPSSLLSNLIK
jgi:hypothetical protein